MFSKSLQIASKKNVVLHSVPELFAVFPVFLEESSFFDDYSIGWIFSRTFPDIKKVNIVFNTDSLCEKCPNKLCENKCASQEKVSLIDEKMIKYFSIKEGIQNYIDLENQVYNKINEEIFDDICKECEWYNMIDCKKYILKV